MTDVRFRAIGFDFIRTVMLVSDRAKLRVSDYEHAPPAFQNLQAKAARREKLSQPVHGLTAIVIVTVRFAGALGFAAAKSTHASLLGSLTPVAVETVNRKHARPPVAG